MAEVSQSYEDALKIESGGMSYSKQYPFVYCLEPFHPSVAIQEWRTSRDGIRHLVYLGEKTDTTRYESDDGDFIDVGLCRSCKSPIKSYSEKFYKKIFEYNIWHNYELSAVNGYCKQCALKKATINNGKWNPSLCCVDRYETKDAGSVRYREIKLMQDGSEVYEMTDEELRHVPKN